MLWQRHLWRVMASARLRLDLDDGVKANYPKFYPLVEPIKGLESSNDD